MVLVDDRIGSKDLVTPLTHLGTPAKLSRLSFGDCAFWGSGPEGPVTVGMELKTLSDLLTCLDDGRFAGHQLPGLLATYDYTYLVIEGLWRPDDEGRLLTRRGTEWREAGHGQVRVLYRQVDNFLSTLEVVCGVRVRRSSSRKETARMISDSYWWWQKDWNEHGSHLKFHTPAPPKLELRPPSLFRRVVKEIDGIGWERSKAVERHFAGSFTRMLTADEGEWQQIDGIGKVMATRIVGALHS